MLSRFSESPIRMHHALLVGIIFLAAFTRLWRLGEPTSCYFDEVYFPTTGALIWHSDDDAWNWIGSENTHPPLSKEFMAVGYAMFGNRDLNGTENGCWGDAEDVSKKTSDAWAFDMFGARFFGAVTGIFSIIFMYLIARRLFNNEVAALSSAFLLCMDGLVLSQSRIATPDTYVLCFTLGSVYFLLKRNWLVSGIFLAASAASKWIGAFTVIPIVLYFAWAHFRDWRETNADPSLREAERVMIVGSAGVGVGFILFVLLYVFGDGLSWTPLLGGGVPIALGLFVVLGGLVAILTDSRLRGLPRAKVYIRAAYSYPLFFIAVPFAVYMATYIPMFAQGHGLNYWWELNDLAYSFHSGLGATHPSQSKFYTWPIDYRPVFFYLGGSESKIYNLGNPMVFWMALPALVFCLWQGVKNIRLSVESGSAMRVWGRVSNEQWTLLFVVLGYLGFWLALSSQGRALFLYHYQPALAFAVLATGYTIGWLWQHANPMGRYACIAYLVVVGVTFIYFYPHWTGVDVSSWHEASYYWFDSWR
jgi:dolichyl-phosphate-mannose--protein O-mannosyl transferase